MKLMTIGGAMQDIFISKTEQPLKQLQNEDGTTYLLLEEGAKIEVDQLRYALGGGATNAAASCVNLEHDVTAFFKIGSDPSGTFILEHIKARSINVQTHAQTDTTYTGTSLILPAPSGNHALLVYRGANTTIEEHEIPFHVIKQQDGIYLTSLLDQAATHVPNICKFAHEHGLTTAANPGKSQLTSSTQHIIDALPYLDIFILNARESRQLLSELSKDAACVRRLLKHKEKSSLPDKPPTLLHDLTTIEDTCLDIRQYFSEIYQRGPRIIVVTNGSEGVYVATHDTIYFHKSIPTDIINTVGAGDAFGSTFFSMLMQNAEIQKAIAYGVINSAAALTGADAQSGLLTRHELDMRYDRLNQTEYMCSIRWQ